MTDASSVALSRNGRLLARVTGWRWQRMTVSAARGPEPCYHRGAYVVAMRQNAALRAVVYGAPDALGRRVILASKRTLCEAIRWANAQT